MTKYCVPKGPILRAIERHCAEHEMTLEEFSHVIWPGAGSSRFYKIMKQEGIDFDLADRILCKTNQRELWIEDPELSAAYQSIDLAALDTCRPVQTERIIRERNEKIKRVVEQTESLAEASRILGIHRQSIQRVLAA